MSYLLLKAHMTTDGAMKGGQHAEAAKNSRPSTSNTFFSLFFSSPHGGLPAASLFFSSRPEHFSMSPQAAPQFNRKKTADARHANVHPFTSDESAVGGVGGGPTM